MKNIKSIVTGLFISIAMIGLTTSAAYAAVIYDNGSPNAIEGRNMDGFLPADDFSLTNTTAIGGAQIFLTSRITEAQWNSLGYSNNYNYFIFGDNTGQPGTLLASGLAQNASVTTSAINTVLPNTLLMTFDFTSDFNALFGQTYWLGLQTTVFTDTFWAHTDSSSGNDGHQADSPGLPNPNWIDRNTDYSFLLTSASVPEPSVLALFGLGLLGLNFARRRKYS